jgi:hypothetical protein
MSPLAASSAASISVHASSSVCPSSSPKRIRVLAATLQGRQDHQRRLRLELGLERDDAADIAAQRAGEGGTVHGIATSSSSLASWPTASKSSREPSSTGVSLGA